MRNLYLWIASIVLNTGVAFYWGPHPAAAIPAALAVLSFLVLLFMGIYEWDQIVANPYSGPAPKPPLEPPVPVFGGECVDCQYYSEEQSSRGDRRLFSCINHGLLRWDSIRELRKTVALRNDTCGFVRKEEEVAGELTITELFGSPINLPRELYNIRILDIHSEPDLTSRTIRVVARVQLPGQPECWAEKYFDYDMLSMSNEGPEFFIREWFLKTVRPQLMELAKSTMPEIRPPRAHEVKPKMDTTIRVLKLTKKGAKD